MNTPLNTQLTTPLIPSSGRPARQHRSRPARRHGPLRNAVRHFVEMVVAMAVGMVVLDPVWNTVGSLVGGGTVLARPDVGVMVMATNMTIAMSVWMRYRKHGWISLAQMGAAMYVPFLVLLAPFWAGLVSADTLLIAGHLLMLPAMVVAMLLRSDEYTRDHKHHS